MILVFLMLSFKPTFSLFSFTFIRRLLSSSSLSAISVVLSAYLMLLIFLLAILIRVCASSSPVFLMMYSGNQSSAGKESACNVGDLGLIPGLGRSAGRGHDNLFQYSCLEKPHRQRNLAGYSPWSQKESGTTERLSTFTGRTGAETWAPIS